MSEYPTCKDFYDMREIRWQLKAPPPAELIRAKNPKVQLVMSSQTITAIWPKKGCYLTMQNRCMI